MTIEAKALSTALMLFVMEMHKKINFTQEDLLDAVTDVRDQVINAMVDPN